MMLQVAAGDIGQLTDFGQAARPAGDRAAWPGWRTLPGA
jgi:hypothetical protein